jgi:hypothetical protein
MPRLVLSMLSLATLASCAQWPQLMGEYKDRLTYSDILQIRALVRQRPELRPIFRICMFWPDRALVDTGTPVNTRDIITSFMARKKGSGWIIDESSIETHEAIITSDARSILSPDLTNRCSQPLAVPMSSIQVTSTLNSAAKLAPASGG